MHAYWLLLIGLLLVLMAFVGSAMDKLPMTPGLIYLLIGYALGPAMFDLVALDPLQDSTVLEVLAEAVVVISLFAVGLNLRVTYGDTIWKVPVRLATASMAITVALVALVGMFVFHMPSGVAVLLGAILAPTDPVLASDVQVRHADDRDRTRFSLTGEGGLNDGTAFPFVLLGLGLLGMHDLGTWGWHWLLVDGVWAIFSGIVVGWVCGRGVGWAVLYIRREYKAGLEWEEFLALGLIALSYGLAAFVYGNGFLAVLTAGLALRRIETDLSGSEPPLRGDPPLNAGENIKATSTYMVRMMLGFNRGLERIGEFVVVLALGVCMSTLGFDQRGLLLALFLFVIIRPLATWLGLIGCQYTMHEFRLISWFGVRGAGSFYYLMYVVSNGAARPVATELLTIVLTVVSISVVVHGISGTPLMKLKPKLRRRRRGS